MANLVPQRAKQELVRDLIQSAANAIKPGLTINLHHRLASDYDAVSRRQRRKVMGDPFYYCELIATSPATPEEYAAGSTSAVPHTFNAWLTYEWADAEPYAGSTQETFDQLTEGLTPDKGILPILRNASHESTPEGPVVVRDPSVNQLGIAPLGQDGGGFDSGHVLDFDITVIEPHS